MGDNFNNQFENGCRPKTNQTFYNGFINFIKENFEHEGSYLIRTYMDVIQQRAISLSRRRFLLRCRTYDNLPSQIYNIKNRLENHHFNCLRNRKNYYNKTHKFAKNLLNLGINDLCLHLTYL